jgi:acyl-CoA reductase-like NAD-dependent aldehyde dehydrogenase
MGETETPVVAGPIINGVRLDPDRYERQESVSPATGETLGGFALCGEAEIDSAVAAAKAAFPAWSALTVYDRAAALARFAEAIDRRRDQIARLFSLEQGKPLRTEAMWEVDHSVRDFHAAAEDAKRLEGSMLQMANPHTRALIYRVPRGVVAAIQPWNFPLGAFSNQVLPALITGNTVVSIPAPTTTLTAHEFVRCMEETDMPPGVLNLVTGQGAVVGDAITAHPDVSVVAFTGSVATGERVAQRAWGKAQLIELGGNGPTVVLEDADLELAVRDAVNATYAAAGQNCIAAGRFLVHGAVYEEFSERLVAAVAEQVRLGHPLDDATTMGPINNQVQATKIDRHVETAVAAGATVLAGGQRSTAFPTDLYWEPTVLSGVTEAMPVAVEETFGPIAPIQKISSDGQAREIMHCSPYGLWSSVYTRDTARGLRFAEQASTGGVSVNGYSGLIEDHIPVGGRAGKLSGIGRVQGRYPMEEIFTELKPVLINIGAS